MSRGAIRRVDVQTLHYLARPHSEVPRRPVGGPAAWVAADHADAASWTRTLEAFELASVARELEAARGEPLTRTVALRALAAEVPGWRRVLGQGRGFLRLRGVPVDDWPREDVDRFFASLGARLGTPGAQNDDGDLLGHVRDVRPSPGEVVRQYKTNEAIPFHCDAADVVGLLCLRTPRVGGRSRIASSVAIFDRVVEEDPELAALLFEPFYLDSRGDGGVDAVPVRPAAYHQGALRTFYHSSYFRSAERHPGIPPLNARQRALLDRYDELAGSPEVHLEMELAPGDVQLVSNHTIVHSRTGYQDFPEPERRRHLLRLWLSLPTSRDLRSRWLRLESGARLLRGLAAARLRRRRRAAA